MNSIVHILETTQPEITASRDPKSRTLTAEWRIGPGRDSLDGAEGEIVLMLNGFHDGDRKRYRSSISVVLEQTHTANRSDGTAYEYKTHTTQITYSTGERTTATVDMEECERYNKSKMADFMLRSVLYVRDSAEDIVEILTGINMYLPKVPS